MYKKNKVERGCVVGRARGTRRRGKGEQWVWVCMAPRKEKSAQENEVERGCEKNPQKRTPAFSWCLYV